MRKIIFGFWVVIFCTMACKGNKGRYAEMERGNIKLCLITPIPSGDGNYMVRIIMSPQLIESKKMQINKMIYNADSIFYISQGEDRQYPSNVEFVASGIAGCYEYVAHFGQEMNTIRNFVFDDKYVTQEEYEIRFK